MTVRQNEKSYKKYFLFNSIQQRDEQDVHLMLSDTPARVQAISHCTVSVQAKLYTKNPANLYKENKVN